ncbi:MAG: hypothetical protein JXN61_02805, partial [Sedimentisphaerales bacterium]|nr:hypothetical protein [Sedimentisphaerales bacterium]
TWDHAWAGFNWTADVTSATVPLTGAANALSMQNAGTYPAAMTWSEQSLPGGTNIETMTPAAFTIEASFKATTLSGYHTIVGRDDRYVATSNGDLAALYFQVVPGNAVAFKFTDVAGYWHELISDPGVVTTGQWYDMVGVSDGLTMSLYLDNELIEQIDLTLSGSPDTALALGSASGGDWQSGTWTVGRGLYAGGHVDRWFGYIDEIRISDSALDPLEFLQVSVKADDPVPADGSSVPPQYADPNVYMILDYKPGVGAVTHTAYFSDVEQDVIDRDEEHCLGSVPPWPEISDTAFVVGYDYPGIPEYARTPLVAGKTYYWCIDESDGTATHNGDVWSFTVMPKEAWGPTPPDGAELVSQNLTCTWHLGNQAISGYTLSYDVYCGTDEDAIAAIAMGATTAPQYVGNVPTETIDLGLNPLTEYFWRVDTKLKKLSMPPTTTYTKGEVWSFTTGPKGIGGILREWWFDIGGGDLIADLKNHPDYPDNPTGSDIVNLFEGPIDLADYYGTRLHGWLYVTTTGDYTFWIATDNQGELWLSTDMNPANATLIADLSGGDNWAPVRGWTDPDVHPSVPIHLEAGQYYYISGLMKDGVGGDNIAVAWQGPDSGGVREVIPGKHLIPYSPVVARNPNPPDRSFDAALNTTLKWTAGIDQSTGSYYTTQHVYVGSNATVVAAATTASPEYKGAPTGPNEYGPLSLSYYEKVYWRVDGVSADTGTVVYRGSVWTFRAIYDPEAIADPNLRLWLKFDDNSLDSSGYGRDGTEMNGPIYSTGYDGQAIVLDGTDDYVDLPIGADIAALGSSTFAAWVNFSNLGGDWQRIFDFGSGTTTYLFLCPRTGADGPVRFVIKPPDGDEQIVDTTTYLSTGWHHLAVTIDAQSTTVNVYLDGGVVGTNAAVTLTPSDVGYSAQNWIGRSQYVADGYFNGSIDDFRIYDYAKDAAGIAEIMRIDLSWAWNPYPENNAQDVARDAVLTWTLGDGATAHTIWLGADDPANMVKVAGPQGP